MGQNTKEHFGDKIRRHLQGNDGGEKTRDSRRLEPKRKKGDGRIGRLEKCAQVTVDMEAVESLLRPENVEVSLRYMLKHSTRNGNIFQLFDTSIRENRTSLWQAEDNGWRVR